MRNERTAAPSLRFSDEGLTVDLLVACAAGLSGYLLGGMSLARMEVRAETGGAVTAMELVTPDGQGYLRVDPISASAVRLQFGSRYGVLVGVLDTLKALSPTLVWRLALPDQPYFLICAAATVLRMGFPIMRSLSRTRNAEIDGLSRPAAGGASQPADDTVDDQPSRAAS